MHDDLIKRLRNRRICIQQSGNLDDFPLLQEAADAIEKSLQKEKFHDFLWNTIQPNEMEQYISMYNAGNEKVETK